MLRQTLADAEGQQQDPLTTESTTSSLDPSAIPGLGGGGGGYGATSTSETEEGEQESSHLQSSFEEGDADYILDDDDDDEEDDDEDDDDEWQHDTDGEDQDSSDPPPAGSLFTRVWQTIQNAFVVIANVENLWDSPHDSNHGAHTTTTTADPHHPAALSRSRRRKNHLVVLFWFVMLALSYTGERSTFKLLVDRAGPFRLFAVEMVTATHAILLGCIMLLQYMCVGPAQRAIHSLGVPIVDVGLMALMDTATILLVFLSGLRVPPTLTVILVQLILPLTAFLTQFVHPDGRCSCNRGQQHHHHSRSSNGHDVDDPADQQQQSPGEATALLSSQGTSPDLYSTSSGGSPAPDSTTTTTGFGGLALSHVWGSVIIFASCLLALSPAFYAIADPDFFYYADAIPMRTAINTLLYAFSSIPAAASQLYKEHVFVSNKQPVNMDWLNLLLSVFQFIFASILSPLLFGLQGLGARGDWTTLYPSTAFSENYLDGLRCFFGGLSDDDQENKYPDDARCDLTLGLVLMHALSIIVVGVAVDKIVQAGATNLMFRGISAGIILSVLCMYLYDTMTPEFNYGPAVDALNMFCLILLVLGSEVYHRVSLQDSSFETEYPMVEPIYLAE